MNCHSCGTELPVGAAFCPTCGVTTLSSDSDSGVSPYNPTIAPSTPNTPPRESPLPPTQLASPFYEVPQKNPYEQALPYTDTPPPPPMLRTRIAGRTILSVFFYLWGVFWLIFGLVGGILHDASSTISGLIFVVCCVVGLVILIFLLRSRKHFYLGTRRRLLLEISLTLIGFLFFCFFVVVFYHQNSLTAYVVLGSVFVIYGLITAFVAYW
jgi:hypothetical protein